jgi:hypothetical protein
MPTDLCDITTYYWLEHDSVGLLAVSHAQSLALFRDQVVRPSLVALDTELDRIQRSDDPSSVFLVDDYAELVHRTVEGYLIATQSMWERGLRQLLVDRDRKLNNGKNAKSLQDAKWTDRPLGLLSLFETLLGLPIQAFDTYADLDLLHALGNAIRHGDGASARRVYNSCPSLWVNWLTPGSTIEVGQPSVRVPPYAPSTPPFSSITLPQALLSQMLQSVIWFWDDIEHMRCNSFKRKHESVDRKLADWKIERLQRSAKRIWSP